MRNVSKKYIETMETRRDFYAVGEITFADGTQKTLSKEDFSLTGNSVIDSSGSTSFPLGLLIPKQITLSLVNDDDRWSEYDFYGASIYLQTKFDLDDGTTESLNIGTFTVISPETYGTTVEVTAMDDSYKTDKPYDTQNDYPMSVGMALRDCCSTCDILLGTSSFPNSDYVIPQKPENITHRQFIGLCAQIAGGNARFDEFNRLEIIAYDFSPLGITAIDGGTFKPWTKGENYDGGTFNPWTTGDTIDGGTFGDRDNIHVLYQYKSGIVIEVDDVVITGVQMESEDEEGNKTPHLYGKEGYVLSLENQLAVGKEEEVLRRIGEKIVGITFRPFSGDHIALPTAEFMDLAYIIDRKQNVYKTVLTDVTFNYFGYTNLKCTADSPLRNSSTHLSNEVKAIIEARKMVERERTEREKALDTLADQLAKSSGLYLTEEVQPDKSVIYYMHDKPTLGESMIVWKLTANAFGISNDGGKTYPYGLDASGVAILERIYAIGINADYITTGAFEIRKDGKIMVLMDKDTGEVILRPDTFELSSGATIDSIAEEKANSAASGALDSAKQYVDEEVNNFISATYDPKIADLQKQLDGQIESFYYDYEPSLDNIPASNWTTETDRTKHEGDLFYWKSKGYAYRFFKDGSTWTWQMVQDTDITKALANAAAAQDTADHKRRVFVATPTTPYDVGDLWVQGKDGDILRCQTARSVGASYVPGDWIKASKYTDDSALTEFIEGDFATLAAQADKKAETWYQTADPSKSWTSAEKTEHTGDLWYDSTESVQKYYRWNGSTWQELTSTPPDAVFDRIDGKAQVFVAQPTPPYYEGDLWFGGTSSDVKVCTNTRTSGYYNSGDWVKRDKYTDDTAANEAKASITLVDGKIESEVTRATDAEGKLSSRITQNETSISSKVSRGDVSSMISQSADEIRLKSAKLVWTSDNSSMTSDGTFSCKNAEISGRIYLGGTGNWGKLFIDDRTGTEVGSLGTDGLTLNDNYDRTYSSTFISLESNTEKDWFEMSYDGIEGNHPSTDAQLFIYGNSIELQKGVNTNILMQANGNFTAKGTKNRAVDTKDFGSVLQYCYETPSPMFGDIGSGKTDETGICYVYFDPVFYATVTTKCDYQVFLQKEGCGDIWVQEKCSEYFIVRGTENLAFSWEAKAKQKGYEFERLEVFDKDADEILSEDISYDMYAKVYLEDFEKEMYGYESVNKFYGAYNS